MQRAGILAWALLSATCVVIGAFGPWATVLGQYSASGTQISSKYAGFLVGIAVLGSVAMLLRRATSSAGAWAIVAGVLAGCVGLYEHHHISSALGLANATVAVELPSAADAFHVGWGLDLVIAAALSLVACGFVSLFFPAELEPRAVAGDPAPRASLPELPAGWYRDPNDDSMLRYWNGFGWTVQTAKPAS
ncbi:MAG: DUF2510 domain-containing protein [Gaiellaceae bacterium]